MRFLLAPLGEEWVHAATSGSKRLAHREMTSTQSGMSIVVCGGGIYEGRTEDVLASRCGDGDAAVQLHDLGFRCVK